MGFFRPAWMSDKFNDEKKARDEISKITDNNKLYEIALKAPRESVKSAAIFRITDENVLASLYFEPVIFNSYVADIVLGEIRDKDIIKQIIAREASFNSYNCAAKRGTDGEFLRNIILADSFSIVTDSNNVIANHAYELLVRAVKYLQTAEETEIIKSKFSSYTVVKMLCDLRKDELEGAVGYRFICPNCNEEVVHHTYTDNDVYGEVMKGYFTCGCPKFTLNDLPKECKKKKITEIPTGHTVKYCSCCGLIKDNTALGHPFRDKLGMCKDFGGYKHDYIMTYVDSLK
ncbi:MAG: hypothetical protein J5877_06405 [Clostridia bacterium]|nr:hypothetical protein [Clostridia bacterium]